MRRLVLSLITGLMVLLSGARGFAQSGNADAVLAAARAALGGDAKISAVKTLIATGRIRQLRGENLVPIEFEIQAERPDKYSRRDEFPAQDAGRGPPGIGVFIGGRRGAGSAHVRGAREVPHRDCSCRRRISLTAPIAPPTAA